MRVSRILTQVLCTTAPGCSSPRAGGAVGLQVSCPCSLAGVPVCFLRQWGVRFAPGLSDHQQPHHDRTTDSGDGSHGSHRMSQGVHPSAVCKGRTLHLAGMDCREGPSSTFHCDVLPRHFDVFSNKYILMEKSWIFMLLKYLFTCSLSSFSSFSVPV